MTMDNGKSIKNNGSFFSVGDKYTKKAIYEVLSVPENKRGGNWDTGYHKYEGVWYIFCNIGSAGRTGHDYNNRLSNSDLIWYGKTTSCLTHQSIQDIINPESQVLIFYRNSDREPFSFAGRGIAKSVEDTIPVKVIWTFSLADLEKQSAVYPGELAFEGDYFEGSLRKITVNSFERNPQAREACLSHFGFVCQVCGFDFEKFYGEIGKGFIHVHHIIPLSDIGDSYKIDPVKDLRPVCPNCHAMLHRKGKILTIKELKGCIENI